MSVSDDVIPGDRRSPPTLNAWAWGERDQPAAPGQHSGGGTNTLLLPRYVSPFVSSAPTSASLQGEDDEDDADTLLAFHAPPPIQTSYERRGSNHEAATPRSAKSPIGTAMRKPSFSSNNNNGAGVANNNKIESAFAGGVSLTLQDDSVGGVGSGGGNSGNVSSRFDPHSKSEVLNSEYLNSPFSANLTSVTTSPLSTPNFPSQMHTNVSVSGVESPRSPDPYSTHVFSRPHSSSHHLPALVHPPQPHHSSRHVRADTDSAVATNFQHEADKLALAELFISREQQQQQQQQQQQTQNSNNQQNNQGSNSSNNQYLYNNNNNSSSNNGSYQSTSPQQTYTLLPTHQSQPQQVQQQQPSQQHTSSPPSFLPPVVSASPPAGASSASSNSSSAGGGVAYVVLPNGQVQAISMQAIQQHLQPSAQSVNVGTGRPPLIPVGQSPIAQQQQQAYQQPSYQTPSATYDAPPSDGDSFSLATLSTQTLPLFTPAQLPPQPMQSGLRGSSPAFQSQQQQQPPSSSGLSPLVSASSVPTRSSNGNQSHSAYSSPLSTGMSMQQRVAMRRDAAAAAAAANQHQRTSSSNNASLLQEHNQQQQQQQQQQMQHGNSNYNNAPSQSPNPTSPLSPQGMAGPSLQRSGSLGSMNVEHAREQVRLLSQQIGPGHGSQHQQSYHPHGEGMVALAKSQAGSRLLQTKLGQGDPVYFAAVFEEVYDAVPDLMTDLFGNYLVQKLITCANDTQRLQLLLKVLPQLLEISCDRQGTRAIQKMIDSLKHTSERQLVIEWLSMPMHGGVQQQQNGLLHIGSSPSSTPQMTSPASSPSSAPTPSPISPSPSNGGPLTALHMGTPPYPAMPRLIHLIRDANGSHVVHSILDSFPPEMLSAIHCNAVHNCRSLGIDQHGLCVLKKCLSMCPLSDFVTFTLRFILEHALEFVNNQYGNYLIQHVLERTNSPNNTNAPSGGSSQPNSPQQRAYEGGDPAADAAARIHLPSINTLLYSRLRGHFARLSRQKFSSNVVEKCLKIPNAELRSAIIAELIEPESIATLLLCSYGNYVLQNVLYVASQEECAMLFARVRPEHVLSSLRKNIRMKWERLLANAHLIHPGLMESDNGSSPQPHSPGNAASQYPSPSAIQLITSILGANTPGGGGGGSVVSDSNNDGRVTPAGASMQNSPMQLSPAIRSVNHSPALGPRGQFNMRPGNLTPQQQLLHMQYPLKSGTGDRRTLIGGSSSAVNSPYHTASAGPGAPHRAPMHSSSSMHSYPATTSVSASASPMLSANNAPYSNQSNQHFNNNNSSNSGGPDLHSSAYHSHPQRYSHSAHSTPNFTSSTPVDLTYSSSSSQQQQQQQQLQPPQQFRSSTPNYPSSTNYNTNSTSYSTQSANSPSIKFAQPSQGPMSSSRQSVQSQPQGSNSAQSLEQQIQAHQAQLQALLAMQAQQQQHQSQPASSQYSVTLLPSTQQQYSSSNYSNQQQSQQQQQQQAPPQQQSHRGSFSHPTSPPLMHNTLLPQQSSQQQQQAPSQQSYTTQQFRDHSNY